MTKEPELQLELRGVQTTEHWFSALFKQSYLRAQKVGSDEVFWHETSPEGSKPVPQEMIPTLERQRNELMEGYAAQSLEPGMPLTWLDPETSETHRVLLSSVDKEKHTFTANRADTGAEISGRVRELSPG